MQGIKIELDKTSIEKVKRDFNNLIDVINRQGKIDLTLNEALIKNDLKKVTDNIDEVIRKYQKLGQVSVTNKLFDDNGKLRSFTVQLERIQGLVEKISYKANLREVNGNLVPQDYSVANIKENDKIVELTKKAIIEREKLESEANALAIRLMNEEEQKRISVTTDAQKRIEQLITGSNETIAQKERRLNQINANDYEKMWLQTEDKIQQETEVKFLQSQKRQRELREQEAREEAKLNNQILEDKYNAELKEQTRIQKMGELKTTFNPDLFEKSNLEIQRYIKNIYDGEAKVVSFQRTLDNAGNSIIKMRVNTKNASNMIEQETITLDKNSASIFRNSQSLVANTARMVGFTDRLKNAFVAVTSLT